MPGIPAPTSGNPTSYYNGLGLTVTGTDLGSAGIKYEVSGSTLDLLAMTGGLTSFYPPGSTLPDGVTLSPAPGTVVTVTHIVDMTVLRNKVPSGTPYMSYSIIQGVTAASAQAAFQTYLAALPLAQLDSTWNATQSTPASGQTRAAKETHYLSLVMTAQRSLFIPGGDKIGEAAVNGTTNNNEFTLSFGVGSPTASTYNAISPVLFLRNMPDFDNVQWTDHPFITSTAAVVPPLDIYVKFEVYNPATSTYVPVNSNLTVELKNYNVINSTTITSTTTNANGIAQFNVPGGATGEDYFFKILNPTAQVFEQGGTVPITLPSEWATKGDGTRSWQAVNGEDGYFDNFFGSLLGTPSRPLTYRIGVDYHVTFEYRVIFLNNDHEGARFRDQRNTNHFIPRTTRVEMYTGDLDAPQFPYTDHFAMGGFTKIDEFRLPANGAYSGLTFTAEPERDVFFKVFFEIEDASINLEKAVVTHPVPQAWLTSYGDTNYNNASYDLKEIRTSSIGSPTSPRNFLCDDAEFGKSFDYLFNLSEYSYLLYHLTDGTTLEWPGVELSYKDWITGAFSWPVGSIQITNNADHRFDRDVLIHETGHQVWWWSGNYGGAGVFWEVAYSNLKLDHFANQIANEKHAIIEGWAEFWGVVFTGYFYEIQNVYYDQMGTAFAVEGTPNRGMSVEGLFAVALAEIFFEMVVTPALPRYRKWRSLALNVNVGKGPYKSKGYLQVNEGDDGNPIPAPGNGWITDSGVQTRFMDIIWKPATALDYNVQEPTTREFIDNMLGAPANASIAHILRGYWQAQNLAADLPVLNSVTVSGGPNASTSAPTSVTINGDKFSVDVNPSYRTAYVEWEVLVNSAMSTNVTVTSSTQMTALVPALPAGTYNMMVHLKVRGKIQRTVTLPNAITYA
ncbi:MAG: hypothetical protein AAGN35_16080 [Bacteroidota bacterium]